MTQMLFLYIHKCKGERFPQKQPSEKRTSPYIWIFTKTASRWGLLYFKTQSSLSSCPSTMKMGAHGLGLLNIHVFVVVFPLYRSGNWDLKKLNNLPKVIQLKVKRSKIQFSLSDFLILILYYLNPYSILPPGSFGGWWFDLHDLYPRDRSGTQAKIASSMTKEFGEKFLCLGLGIEVKSQNTW